MKTLFNTINLAFLLTIWLSCNSDANNDTSSTNGNSLQVEGFVVSPSHFNSKVLVTAELYAKEQVQLMAPMDGQVLEISFKEGQKIKEGSSIIRLDDRQWIAQLSGLNAELDAANKDYERKKSLLEIEGSSQEEIDNIVKNIANLKAKVAELQVNVTLANVKAPFSGQLGIRNFSRGTFLNKGDEITVLTALDQLKLDFSIAQEYKNSVKVGDEVLAIINSDSIPAEIYVINPVINESSRTINVRALIDQPKDITIMPGTFAEVLISTNATDKALLIPTQAIVPKINDETVYIYRNGVAKRQTIVSGDRNESEVNIISGLNAGDTIITTGLLQVKDGLAIELQSVKSK